MQITRISPYDETEYHHWVAIGWRAPGDYLRRCNSLLSAWQGKELSGESHHAGRRLAQSTIAVAQLDRRWSSNREGG